MELSNHKFPTCKGCICKDCMHNGGVCSGCEKCLGTQTTECPIDLYDNDGQQTDRELTFKKGSETYE